MQMGIYGTMKNVLFGVLLLIPILPLLVWVMLEIKSPDTKAIYTSEVRGYVIGKGLTDRATPFVTLHTTNGATDVLIGNDGVYNKIDQYDVVFKHANCDAVRVMKTGGKVLCATMLSEIEVRSVLTQQELGSYCNCETIAEPEPVEVEEIDSLGVEVDSVVIEQV